MTLYIVFIVIFSIAMAYFLDTNYHLFETFLPVFQVSIVTSVILVLIVSIKSSFVLFLIEISILSLSLYFYKYTLNQNNDKE